MSFYIDKHNRRKSPIALAAFGAALLYVCVFSGLTLLLAEPLYRLLAFESDAVTTAVHSAIIAILGTALCCLLFLLKDKRVAPYGFAGLAVILLIFYAAAMSLDGESRSWMLRIVTMFGLAPALVGNAVTWPIYLKMKRANPALNHRKTIQQELREAMDKQAAKRPADPAPAAPEQPVCTPEEAMFGPETGSSCPPSFRSAQEEAMLLYEDDDEESDD